MSAKNNGKHKRSHAKKSKAEFDQQHEEAGFLSVSLKNFMSRSDKAVILLIGLGIVVLIILSSVLVINNKERAEREALLNAVPTLTPTPTPIPGETIMVTVHGFVPDEVTVKKGTFINFANFSETNLVDIESDDHPSHEKYPDLNVGNVRNNDVSDPVEFDKLGTYTYHNHLKPQQKGSITVED